MFCILVFSKEIIIFVIQCLVEDYICFLFYMEIILCKIFGGGVLCHCACSVWPFFSSLTRAFLHLLASFLVTLCQVGYLQGNQSLSTNVQGTMTYLQFVDKSTVFPLFNDDSNEL